MDNKELLKKLKENYDNECKSCGYPQDYCVNENLYWAIHKLEYALGLQSEKN